MVADAEHTLVISETGCHRADDGVSAIGSGDRTPCSGQSPDALFRPGCPNHCEESMKIAASICIYTNNQIIIEEL